MTPTEFITAHPYLVLGIFISLAVFILFNISYWLGYRLIKRIKHGKQKLVSIEKEEEDWTEKNIKNVNPKFLKETKEQVKEVREKINHVEEQEARKKLLENSQEEIEQSPNFYKHHVEAVPMRTAPLDIPPKFEEEVEEEYEEEDIPLEVIRKQIEQGRIRDDYLDLTKTIKSVAPKKPMGRPKKKEKEI